MHRMSRAPRRHRLLTAALLALSTCIALPPPNGHAAESPSRLAERFAEAVRKVNAAHAKKPGDSVEFDLAARLPKSAHTAVTRLVAADDSAKTRDALSVAGEAALDLDLMDAFSSLSDRLRDLDPDGADALGIAVSRERFLVRGIGGVDPELLVRFSDVLDAVLDQYARTFGFREWSKVPGKKLRVRVHLVERITRPPHFAPQFPFHSEIDFPIVDPQRFASPTSDGKFLFYGLCHELGHVIAMWGDRDTEADHHAWAHYTGVVIVEELANSGRRPGWAKDVRDVRWRSLTKERARIERERVRPSRASRDGVLALLIALHDSVGPRALGDALNYLDEEDECARINRVRYYTFAALRDGLLATLKSAKSKKIVVELLE